MAKLFKITPIDKKSIYIVYDVYKIDEQKNVKGFVVRELYRWGQGFREIDEPVYTEDKVIICDPNLGWGAELDDSISIDFEYDGEWTEEEKEELENIWLNGDPNDEDNRYGAAWLYDFSDWEVEDEYLEILGPFKVDIIDDTDYNTIIEENIKLESRPKLDSNSSWPFK